MVRLKLTFLSNNYCEQKTFDRKFRSIIKGYIYKKLEDSTYNLNKSNSSFRYFSFSNLFFIKNGEFKAGEFYNIIISSPKSDLIMEFLTKISIGDKLGFGEWDLEIVGIKPFREEINKNSTLISSNFIVCKGNGEKIFLNFETEKEEFLKILKNNILKKYYLLTENRDVTKEEFNFNLFENIKIEPMIYPKKNSQNKNSSHFSSIIEKEGIDFRVMGNKLRFIFNEISDKQLEIFSKVIDSGFGSMNSYGFGFVKVAFSNRGGGE